MLFNIEQNLATAIINDDYTGLDDNEIKLVEVFTKDVGLLTVYCYAVEFSKCELTGIMSDCVVLSNDLDD